jgi:hypothetical protein
MSENQDNTSSPKTWERLVFELFEDFFCYIVPGSIAVFLYVPSFTDKLMKDSNFTSALIFLILAFVVGAALNIVSLFVPHFLLKPMRKTVFIPLILAFVSVAALQQS